MVVYKLLFVVLFGTFSAAEALEVHEWGTFTSLQGSDGKNQQGLHHGDERLPNFVFCPEGLGFSYGDCLSLLNPVENSLLATTQRLETPVIYFYSDKEQKVHVKVDFPKGVFSEWFPKADSFSPGNENLGPIQTINDGKIEWTSNLKIGEDKSLEGPAVSTDSIWFPSRQVKANYIESNGDKERFIFYRGIGNFELPIKITSSDYRKIKVANNSSELIPSVFILKVENNKGYIQNLGALKAGEVIEHTDRTAEQALYYSVQEARDTLKNALVKDGLFEDEAMAMVNTWTKSYFHTNGLRVFYVLPRKWTDDLLPIKVTPKPKKLIRTLVGRIEVMTNGEESTLLRTLEIGAETNNFSRFNNLFADERFREPKLWRLLELTKNSKSKKADNIKAFLRSLLPR